MRYQELQTRFGRRPMFSLDDIRQVAPGFDKSRLYEWAARGWIKRLLRGYYYFNGAGFDEQGLFSAANAVYRPSCISLESAMSYYGLIPEKPLSVTSVSTRKTAAFITPVARLAYRKVLPRYYFGYVPESGSGGPYLIACPEKALIDYFYFTNSADIGEAIESLRLNRSVLRKIIAPAKLTAMAGVYESNSPGLGAKMIRGII